MVRKWFLLLYFFTLNAIIHLELLQHKKWGTTVFGFKCVAVTVNAIYWVHTHFPLIESAIPTPIFLLSSISYSFHFFKLECCLLVFFMVSFLAGAMIFFWFFCLFSSPGTIMWWMMLAYISAVCGWSWSSLS